MKKTIMTVIFSFLCVTACLLMSPAAFAVNVASGMCGENLEWVLDDEGLLTISGTGDMQDAYNNPAFWQEYCDSIYSVNITDGVTSIGEYAFSECSSLTSVTIPSSVSSIREGAFLNCGDLTSVTIPEGVTSVGEDAFSGCRGLESVTIPSSVTSIGNGAFTLCTELTSVTIQEGVTSIGQDAFLGCYRLTSVTIPESVTSIGDGAFHYCSGLADSEGFVIIRNVLYSYRGGSTAVIPSSVTSIGYLAFENCSSLTSVTIPDSVTSIGEYAFRNCRGLTSVTIPSSVTSIGNNSFDGSLLADVYYPGSRNQWNAITVGADNTALSGAMLHLGRFDINLDSRITNGSVSVKVNGEEAVTALENDFVSLTVTPDTGYELDTLTVRQGETEVTVTDNSFTMPAGDVTVTVAFAKESIDSGICGDDLSWMLYADGELAISGTGDMHNFAAYNAPWQDHWSSIYSVNITDGITSIGGYAFHGCSSLTSVTIPSSVTSIGNSAFYSCSSLTRVTIPEDVMSIGNSAFHGCSSLTSVTIPSSVTSIEFGTFSGCFNLTNVTIPSSVTSIGESAFSACTGLTSVTIPSSVTSIGRFAFFTTGLTSVTIPSSVTSIGERAFCDCSSLTSVTIPSSVTSIDGSAFENCISLTSVTIPSSVTSIGERAFSGSSLTSVTIEEGVTSIGEYAFSGNRLTSVTIPSSVTSIGESVFSNCRKLKTAGPIGSGYNIEFGWTTAIPDSAFSGCSSLTSVMIPEGVTSIGTQAFYNCSGLTSMTIPSSVTSIGNNSFDGSLLADVYYPGSRNQWNAITVGADNTALSSAMLHLGRFDINLDSRITNGSVSVKVNGEEAVTALENDFVSLTITPDTGYELDTLTVRQGETEVTVTDNSFTMPAGDVTVMATFKKLTYTITWLNEDDSEIDTTTVEYGTVPTHADAMKPATAEYTYTFAGWTPEVTAVTGDATYKAEFTETRNSYTITWLNEDDSEIDTTTVEYGTVPTHADAMKPATAEYTYTFAGWIPEVTAVTGDAIYKATFHYLATYTVTYDANGGTNAPMEQIKTQGVDLTLTADKPARENSSVGRYLVFFDANGGEVVSRYLAAARTTSYAFNGWNTVADGSGTAYEAGGTYTDEANVTMYAQWAETTETAAVTLPEPTREGYDFKGWAEDAEESEGIMGDYTPKDEVTLYAIWEAHTYTVTYDANGGTNAPESQTKTHDVNLTLASQLPVRNGYTFLGWATSAEAAKPEHQPRDSFEINADTTLYALWMAPDFVAPAALKTIEEEAFEGGAFAYVKLSEGTESIQNRAFAACPNLRYIYIPEATESIHRNAFEGISELTILGHRGSYAEYYAESHGFDFFAVP